MAIPIGGSGGKREFEAIKEDEWINGGITGFEEKKGEKKYKDKETDEEITKVVDLIRIVFKLDNYNLIHKSRWETKSMYSGANLYKNYINKLFPAKYKSNDLIDLEKMKDLKVKTMWGEIITYEDGNKFQPLVLIKLQNKDDINKINILIDEVAKISNAESQTSDEEDIPF